MEPGTILLLLGGGLIAGFVNTVAGGGSVVTLPLLVGITGCPIAANGTNRVAILLQNVAGVATYQRGGMLESRRILPVLPAVLLGAVGGAWLATEIPPETMRRVFAVVIVLVALTVVVRPSRWLGRPEARFTEPWRSLTFFAIGFYGGFVQAGVGFLLLAGLVLGSGFDLVRGNAAKVFLVLLYTPITLAFFWSADQVWWIAGLILAAGNVTGALVAARLAITRGTAWIRVVLVLAALGAASHMILTR